MPLLAPQASTITLSTASTVVQANGTTDIRATVLEPSGTPVQNGTTVTFTTNLGSMSPVDVRTMNGVALARFVANGQSGTAAIKAISGGAASEALTLTVGAAAANGVTLNANPTRVGAGGGPSVITATVTDISGNPVQSVPVTFSSTAGSFSATSVNTNQSGIAVTTLTTNREATVTATVAGKTATVTVGVALRPTVTISTSGEATVGGPTTFTISVTPAAGGAPIQQVTISYGDGDSTNLGPVSGSGITVQHIYDDHDTYTVTVTATDLSGESASASTVIVVQPVVIVSLAASTSGKNCFVYRDGESFRHSRCDLLLEFWRWSECNDVDEPDNAHLRHRWLLQCHCASDNVQRAPGVSEHDRQHSTVGRLPVQTLQARSV